MPTKLNGYSSSAASLWGDVMGVVHEGLSYKEIEKPDTVVTANVCRDSGKLATDLCAQDQRGSRVRTEYFIEGTQPTTACDVHVTAKVNIKNNKLATASTAVKKPRYPTTHIQPILISTCLEKETVCVPLPIQITPISVSSK